MENDLDELELLNASKLQNQPFNIHYKVAMASYMFNNIRHIFKTCLYNYANYFLGDVETLR